MLTASTRAEAVAQVLYELRKAEKLATLTSIAKHAGFSPGAGSRTITTCLKTVRREWPHLQWWRAVADNGQLEVEQESLLIKAGFETETQDGVGRIVKSLDAQLMSWDEPECKLEEDPAIAS